METNHIYRVISELSEDYASQVLSLYKQAWWAKTRDIQDTLAIMKGSTCCFGLLDNTDKLVGFARVLSDYSAKAIIYDVIIDDTIRSKGLGILLLEAVLASSSCIDVAHVELYCKEEMIPFYVKLGFENITDEVRFLRLKKRRFGIIIL